MSSRQDHSKEPQPPILSLPKEILEVILNYIPQNETLNLRLVCKAWNNDVQNFYNYEVKGLDEISRRFQPILDLRIHKLSLNNLRVTSVLNSEGIPIFRYPELIRELEIEEFPSVSPKNLQQLLPLLCTNLRSIDLFLNPQHLKYEFKWNEVFQGYKFPSLKSLKITFSESSETIQENPKSLFEVLENSSMPQLQILIINFCDLFEMTPKAMGKLGENVLRILSRNGLNLQILDIFLIDYDQDSELRELPAQHNEELNRILQMDRVQEFQIRLNPFALQLQDFWRQVLSNQKQLVTLYTYEYPGGPISIPLCRQIIINNCTTLVDITIFELEILANDPPFNLSLFQACKNLQRLTFHGTTMTDPGELDVREFHRLPESITYLSLLCLNILSEELLVGFTQGFKNLAQLSLIHCGKHGLLGVNWPVLSQILSTSRPLLITNIDLSNSINCDDESLEIELGRLGLSLSDFDQLIRSDQSSVVQVGFLGKISNMFIEIARKIGSWTS